MKIPFTYTFESKEILNSYQKILEDNMQNILYINNSSVLNFFHGDSFEVDNKITHVSFKCSPPITIDNNDIINNNVNIINSFVKNNITYMEKDFSSELTNSINTDQNIPIVLKKDCWYETYLEILELIGVSINQKNNIILPYSPDFPENFDYLFQNATPQLKEKFNTLFEIKKNIAITQETIRLNKYEK